MSLEDWKGRLAGRRPTSPDVPVIGEVLPWATASRPGVTPHGSSVPFRVIDKAGQDWWAKSLTGRHGERATITDAIVGAVAPLISAPTCETSILHFPEYRDPIRVAPRVVLEPSYIHGSRLIERTEEARNVMFVDHDDNQRRWVGVAALYDWCWGVDHQWLFDLSEHHQLYSHDHGLYFYNEDEHWTITSLHKRVNEPHPFEPLLEVLATNPGHCAEYAQALRNVTTEELARALATIPAEWTVGTDELEHLGWFLSERLEPVANRIEQAGGLR